MTDEELIKKYREAEQQPLPFEFEEEDKPAEAAAFYEHPKNDNQRLINYQTEYRQGDKSALDRIYILSKKISMKYINKITNKNKKVKHLSPGDKEAKAHNAATYLVEQYLTRPDFQIEGYATAYLWLRVMHELFYYRKVDKIVDFVDIATFIKEGTEDEETE